MWNAKPTNDERNRETKRKIKLWKRKYRRWFCVLLSPSTCDDEWTKRTNGRCVVSLNVLQQQLPQPHQQLTVATSTLLSAHIVCSNLIYKFKYINSQHFFFCLLSPSSPSSFLFRSIDASHFTLNWLRLFTPFFLEPKKTAVCVCVRVPLAPRWIFVYSTVAGKIVSIFVGFFRCSLLSRSVGRSLPCHVNFLLFYSYAERRSRRNYHMVEARGQTGPIVGILLCNGYGDEPFT